MMKKWSLFALLLCMALTLGACTSRENQSYYESAQLYLGCGDYDYAAELFSQLGEYEDSAEYTLYCRALEAMEAEEYDLARANFNAIKPFKSSERYLRYLNALSAEKSGEMEKALNLYEQLGTFADAHLAVERLKEAIPEATMKEARALMAKGEYAAAREMFLSLDGYGASETYAKNCTTALNKAAYAAAEDLLEEGDPHGAMAAFIALGDALDAKERADQCLEAIHEELEARFATVTLGAAAELAEAYARLGEDEKAQARITELNARFGKNLDLIRMDSAYVQLGEYPGVESGEERPVLWRVIKKEGALLTLLSDAALDAAAEAKTIPVAFADAIAPALGEITLPAMTDLASLGDMQCTGTAYALAQGAANAEGKVAYWLRDSLENGLHPMISTAGALMLPTEGATPGIRPMITLNLDAVTLTLGTGTAEDPFRAE